MQRFSLAYTGRCTVGNFGQGVSEMPAGRGGRRRMAPKNADRRRMAPKKRRPLGRPHITSCQPNCARPRSSHQGQIFFFDICVFHFPSPHPHPHSLPAHKTPTPTPNPREMTQNKPIDVDKGPGPFSRYWAARVAQTKTQGISPHQQKHPHLPPQVACMWWEFQKWFHVVSHTHQSR